MSYTVRTCAACPAQIVPQTQHKAALADGLDVRAHEGRGLCTPCYTRARVQGRRTAFPQVRTGELGPRSYGASRGRSPSVVPITPEARAAALTCAEWVPVADLRLVLDVLGLTHLNAQEARTA